MRTSLLLSAVAVLIMVGGAGCGDDDSLVEALVAKLRQCDLMTDGRINMFQEPDTAVERCYLNCYLAASCDDLEAEYCYGTLSPATEACLNGCYTTPDDFVCADGSGTIPGYFVCDGEEDCADGSDEVGCGSTGYECADGSGTIPDYYVCDGEPDCYDGSDETGCPPPPQFRCADGTFVFAYYDCDGEPDCPDGSDEIGCAQISCPQ